MILRIRRSIRSRPPNLLLGGAWRGWLLVAACASAGAGTPGAGTPPGASTQPPAVASGRPASGSQPPATSAAGSSDAGAPDESLLEFLGSDDVGDAAWWEFLKKAPPLGKNASARLPQDAKK